MRGLPLLLVFLFGLLAISAEAKHIRISKDSIFIKSPARILLGNKELVIIKDTVIYCPDSLELVILNKTKKIKKQYKKSFVMQHLNAWIFAGKPDTNQIDLDRIEFLQKYNGKIVRSINIRNVNVFGATVSTSKPEEQLNLIERTGNRLHRNTREKTIRNSLNIWEGQKLVPYELSEKEVILRNLPYISDVLITPTLIPNSDSVDLSVAVQDIWSIGFHWEPYSVKRGFFEVYDENAFGYGHEAMVRTRYDYRRSPAVGYEAYYSINNISKEIVQIKAGLASYFDIRKLLFNVQKDYYFKSNYAYGLSYLRYTDLQSLPFNKVESSIKEVSHDAWLGQGFLFRPLNKFDIKKPQLYVAARMQRSTFTGNRYVSANENTQYHNYTSYLGSVAIAKQWYTQTKLLLGYGRTEDIPSGYKLELIGGYEKGEFRSRPYFAFKTAQGGMLDGIGYFAGFAELGGYVKGDSIQQGTFRAGAFYYSNLSRAGLFRFRQLVSTEYTHGFNRFKGLGERLFLDDYEGIRGYEGDSVTAQRRLTLHLETIAYSPYAPWNFKMAFFAYADFAWMSVYGNNPFKGPIYSGVGIGVRFRNESLAFKTFTIRISYFPRVPFGGTSDNFDITGADRLRLNGFKPSKPDYVKYQPRR